MISSEILTLKTRRAHEHHWVIFCTLIVMYFKVLTASFSFQSSLFGPENKRLRSIAFTIYYCSSFKLRVQNINQHKYQFNLRSFYKFVNTLKVYQMMTKPYLIKQLFGPILICHGSQKLPSKR